MSEDKSADWAPGLADTFTYQIDVISTKRALEAEQKRAAKAEKGLKDMAASPWWKLTAKPRALSAKRKAHKKAGKPERGQVGAERDPKLAPSEWVAARESALNSRLQTVLQEFGVAASEESTPALATQLSRIAELLASRPKDKPLAWLTYIAVVAKYPTNEDVLRFSTDVQVDGPPAALAQLLRINTERGNSWSLNADLQLIRDVVVDPTLTSHRTFHTGIQRVVRETVPRWAAKNPVQLMIWGGAAEAFRPPNPAETWRIMEFEPRQTNVPGGNERVVPTTIRVPWQTMVIAPEPTGPIRRAESLACMADWSGSELSTIYYDFIMYLFPEAFKDESRVTLSDYIPAVRTSVRVSAISEGVAKDMRHYAATIANNGMREPLVGAQVLPVEAFDMPEDEYLANVPRVVGVPGLPVVLSVASIEPRKNHIMTMRAAERLWREGVQFQLVIIGWGAWRAEGVTEEFERLQQKGRPIRMIRRADEALLWTAYRQAAFSVYISLVEGYGLPAAESIAAGTPVVLSNIGSMAEIGEGGGALMVDPRDLDGVADAMRTLLTDEAALNELRESARNRPQSTWDDYATATWQWLVHGTP